MGLRVPIAEESHLWFYYYHDHLGSTRRLRMDDKSAAGEYEYTPYGDTYLAHGSDEAFRYTGKPYESRTGLYYFPYRFYNPTTARWLTCQRKRFTNRESRDPLGIVHGPNLYAYVRGNPVTHADFPGLETYSEQGCTLER